MKSNGMVKAVLLDVQFWSMLQPSTLWLAVSLKKAALHALTVAAGQKPKEFHMIKGI
jgi:hypothetical protein